MQLPEIESVQREGEILTLKFAPLERSLFFFQGHFKARAILPAVAQLDMVMRAYQDYYGGRLKFKGVPQVKFMAPLQPHDTVSLRLEFNAPRRTLRFAFSILKEGRTQPASQGCIGLDA